MGSHGVGHDWSDLAAAAAWSYSNQDSVILVRGYTCRSIKLKRSSRSKHYPPPKIWSIYFQQSCHGNGERIAFSKVMLEKLAQFSSVQSLSHVRLFATPWITPCQACLSITNSRSLLKLMSIESVMPSSQLILCHPLLLLPPIPPSISLFQWVNSSHEVAKVLEFQL